MHLSRCHSTPLSPFGLLTSKRRTFLAGGLTLTAAGLVAAPSYADPESPSTEEPATAPPGGRASRAGEPRITEIPLADVETADSDGRTARRITEHTAALVGVTWADDAPVPAVDVRGQLVDGTWTQWYDLEQAVDTTTGEEAAGTEPVFLGDVIEIEIAAELDGVDVTESLTAVLIDFPDDAQVFPDEAPSEEEVEQAAEAALNGDTAPEGHDSADGAAPGAVVGTAGAAGTAVVGTLAPGAGPSFPVAPMALTPKSNAPGQPPFISRAQWGAEEGATRSVSGSNRLDAVVLHHTAGTNNYTASQAAQQIRGIFSYHVKTLGWADIGYNVLVDRFGQIYEGRKGGLERVITGAHAYGFNTGTSGISVMGNFTSVEMSWTVRESVAKVAAWKLLGSFRTNVRETYSQTVGVSGTRFAQGQRVTLPRFYGHRDVNLTSCPGNRAYTQIDTIRTQVQNHINNGWKTHQRAFAANGGEGSLGTVTHIATTQGKYVVTRLTKGIIVGVGTGTPRAYRSETAASWQPAWGLPLEHVKADGSRTIQAFENGVAVREGGRNRFVSRTFRDVAPQRVFFVEIHDLADRGVTRGWGDGTFRPNENNLRDAMIVFIYRAMGSPSYTPPARSPFRDVSTSFVFYRELCWAQSKGIARGWGDGTFRPLIPVQRDAVAAFLYRAAGSPATTALGSSSFRDVPRGHVFDKEIGWLAQTGISRGWSDGTFRPTANIKRDQMATFVDRWMRYTGRV